MLLSAHHREERTPTRYRPRCNPRAPCPIAAPKYTAPNASNASSGFGPLQACCLRRAVFAAWVLRFSYSRKATSDCVTLSSSQPLHAHPAFPLGHQALTIGLANTGSPQKEPQKGLDNYYCMPYSGLRTGGVAQYVHRTPSFREHYHGV